MATGESPHAARKAQVSEKKKMLASFIIQWQQTSDRSVLIAQLVENLPAMQETLVRFLGWEGPLEKGKATHTVFWPGEFHGLHSPWGCKESDMTE